MKPQFAGILFTCGIFFLLFISSNNSNAIRNYPATHYNATPDSNTIDSLQYFVDVYSKLLTTKDSCTKELVKMKSEQLKNKLQNIENYLLPMIKTKIQYYSLKINNSKRIRFRGVECDLFVADLNTENIMMHWANPQGLIYSNIGDLLSIFKALNLTPLMVTNAGMYTEQQAPEGLYIESGEKLVDLDATKRSSDNFYLKPNGVFYIDSDETAHIDTTEKFAQLYKDKAVHVQYATQSGPMLVINGRIHPAFSYNSTNLKIRSGVGIINKKKVVFIISKNEINFYDFALLFKDIFSCNNALFLDGAISKMYLYDIDSNVKDGNFGAMISVSK